MHDKFPIAGQEHLADNAGTADLLRHTVPDDAAQSIRSHSRHSGYSLFQLLIDFDIYFMMNDLLLKMSEILLEFDQYRYRRLEGFVKIVRAKFFSILKWDFMLYQLITFNGKAPFSIYIFKLPTVYLTNLFFYFRPKNSLRSPGCPFRNPFNHHTLSLDINYILLLLYIHILLSNCKISRTPC